MKPVPPTITEALDRTLEDDPERPALVAPSGALSYAQLDSAANAAAAALGELGVSKGNRVAASLPNDLDVVVAFHGAARLGAIWVGVNRALAAPEKEALLRAAAPTVYLADRTSSCGGGPWRTVRCDEPSGWAAALGACDGAPRPPSPGPDSPAGIAFTSGTTGEPKGVVHSHHNLLLPAASLVASRRYDQTLRKGDCLPLTILNLQVLTTLLTSVAGGCCILTDRRDARGVAEWIAREAVNVWNGVPALLYSMVHDPEIDAGMLAGLREVWTGGGPLPEQLRTDFQARFGRRLVQTYGLTEAPTVVAIEPAGGAHADGSSGIPLPHLEVVVRDDAGKPLPAGQLGEISVRGVRSGPWAGAYTPLSGYWRDGAIEPFTGDELRTGDIGMLDGAGNVHVRDRKKLLIIRGGANVYPAEVEQVIERAPGVRSAAVLGLPDPRLGERVVAAVEVDAGSAVTGRQVIELCQESLARYKVPDQVLIVGGLPRNAMGKVQRARLAGLFPPASEPTG